MNIIRTLEKGNKYVDASGNTLPQEKVEMLAKKSYLEKLKKGEIEFSVPFEQFEVSFIEESYIPVSVLNTVAEVIGLEPTRHTQPKEPEDTNENCCPPVEENLA